MNTATSTAIAASCIDTGASLCAVLLSVHAGIEARLSSYIRSIAPHLAGRCPDIEKVEAQLSESKAREATLIDLRNDLAGQVEQLSRAIAPTAFSAEGIAVSTALNKERIFHLAGVEASKTSVQTELVKEREHQARLASSLKSRIAERKQQTNQVVDAYLKQEADAIAWVLAQMLARRALTEIPGPDSALLPWSKAPFVVGGHGPMVWEWDLLAKSSMPALLAAARSDSREPATRVAR